MTFLHRCDAEGCGELIDGSTEAVEVSVVRFTGEAGNTRPTAQHMRHFHASCFPLPLPDPERDPVRAPA